MIDSILLRPFVILINNRRDDFGDVLPARDHQQSGNLENTKDI